MRRQEEVTFSHGSPLQLSVAGRCVAGENSTEPPLLEEFAKHGLICWQDEGMIDIWPVSSQHTCVNLG